MFLEVETHTTSLGMLLGSRQDTDAELKREDASSSVTSESDSDNEAADVFEQDFI